MSKQNFKVHIEIDGKETPVKAESTGHEGGLTIKVYQMDKGDTRRVLVVSCTEVDGILETTAQMKGLETTVRSRKK